MTLDLTVVAYGERAALISCPGADGADQADGIRAVLAAAREHFPEADDVVPGARSVLVDGVAPAVVAAAVSAWSLAPLRSAGGPLVEIPVRYDGPDLTVLAGLWEMSVEAVVARHRDRIYVVEFCGFAPGFAYCSGLPSEAAVPRRAAPRPRVPAGAVAVADRWTAVYPTPSPGGWQLLGTTDVVLWDAEAAEPALLRPGTRVAFVDA